MSITAKAICRDTGNFFCNQFVSIFSISVLCAFITLFLNCFLSPSKENILFLKDEWRQIDTTVLLEIMRKMSREQKKIMLHASAAYSFSHLVGSSILVSSTLLMTRLISAKQHINILQRIIAISIMFPKLFVLIFIGMSLVQIGVILMLIPGILLAAALALSPIILVQDKTSIFIAMQDSMKIAWNHIGLVVPAVITWMLARALLLLYASYHAAIIPTASTVLSNIISNLISEILLIYLFRLHMLIRK